MAQALLSQWEELKRLTFIIDGQVAKRKFTAPRLSDANAVGVRHIESARSTDEVARLTQLVNDLGLVRRRDEPLLQRTRELDLSATIDLITDVFRADGIVEGVLISKVNEQLVQQLCRHAYSLVLTQDGWPSHFPLVESGRVRTGIVVRSLDGRIEGRTTGGRRSCPSKRCNGWLVGVHWQTGQQLHICSEGWHYDPSTDELHVIGGGNISARFVSPKPFGVAPRPRREWPSRSELMKTKAWSAANR